MGRIFSTKTRNKPYSVNIERHYEFSLCRLSFMTCVWYVSHQTPGVICHHAAIPAALLTFFHHLYLYGSALPFLRRYDQSISEIRLSGWANIAP